MEFSISIPQTFPDPARIQRFLKRAEELPIVGAWCIEQVIGTAPVLESVTTLAYTAAVTKRLRLGIAVLIRLSAVTLKIAIWKNPFSSIRMCWAWKFFTAAHDWGRMIFHVSDVGAFWAHLKQKGFEPNRPADASWGERYFHMDDPDGYELSFARPS